MTPQQKRALIHHLASLATNRSEDESSIVSQASFGDAVVDTLDSEYELSSHSDTKVEPNLSGVFDFRTRQCHRSDSRRNWKDGVT